jgi:hypothetical protein
MFESSNSMDATKQLNNALERVRYVPPGLTTAEKEVLANCERVVNAGLETFVEVGQALMTIRDRRLYREKYTTFEDYCVTRWRLSSSRARQLIKASQVVANVESVTGVTLENEAQARALAPHVQEIQTAVAQIAANTAPLDDSGKPKMTADHLRSVAKVLTEVINEGVLDDGSGVPKPLGVLLDANVTEETYERLMRQKQHVKQAIEAKEARAASTGQPRLSGLALEIVRGLIDGIEIWAADGGLHPAIQEAYQRAKRSIGE